MDAILADQRAIRDEMRRLVMRLEDNERRIAALGGQGMGGGAPSPSRPQPTGRGSGGYRQSAGARNYQPPAQGASPPRVAASPGKPTEQKILASRQAVTTAIQDSTPADAWEEPAYQKVSPSAIDRCEQLLRQTFERRFAQRSRHNPVGAAMDFLKKYDVNRSGKLDQKEFIRCCYDLEFGTDEKTMLALFSRYDVDRSGFVTIDELGRMLFKQDGDTESKAKSSIATMREVLSLRAGGFASLQAMGRQWRIMDRDRSGVLSKEEFDIALDVFFKYYKIQFSAAQKNALYQFFDRDNTGGVSYDEFVRGVRGDMNDFRVGLVLQAFDILDRDRSGEISLGEIGQTYDLSAHPGVQSGKVSEREALNQFMSQWDKSGDGIVTKDEFIEAYNWVSASIDSDDYFELMMRNAWHISGGTGWSENTANRRVLVTHGDGSTEVVEIKNDLGLHLDDNQEIVRRLTQQGVRDIRRVDLYGEA